MPGFLEYERGKDFLMTKIIAEGASGEVYLATLFNSELIERAGSRTGVVKSIKCKKEKFVIAYILLKLFFSQRGNRINFGEKPIQFGNFDHASLQCTPRIRKLDWIRCSKSASCYASLSGRLIIPLSKSGRALDQENDNRFH